MNNRQRVHSSSSSCALQLAECKFYRRCWLQDTCSLLEQTYCGFIVAIGSRCPRPIDNCVRHVTCNGTRILSCRGDISVCTIFHACFSLRTSHAPLASPLGSLAMVTTHDAALAVIPDLLSL